MLKDMLPLPLYEALRCAVQTDRINELRLRRSKAVRYGINGKYYTLYEATRQYVLTDEELDYVINRVTRHSLYSCNEQLKEGYVTVAGGIRIGVCGEAVFENNTLYTFKHIGALNIRLPHEIKGIAQKLKVDYRYKQTLLIVSPVGGGKTTLLRDVLRCMSNGGLNCLLIDERCEISGYSDGKCTLDVGDNTDVLTGISKNDAIEKVIRSMRPDMVFCDEIFTFKEADTITDAVKSGVGVACSIHAENVKQLLRNEVFLKIADYISYYCLLAETPKPGTIVLQGDKNAFVNNC